MRKVIIVAALITAAFGAGQASAVGSSPDELTLRNRLLACVAVDEAVQRGISLSRLRVTRAQCDLLR